MASGSVWVGFLVVLRLDYAAGFRAHDPELLELRNSFLGLWMLDQFTVKSAVQVVRLSHESGAQAPFTTKN